MSPDGNTARQSLAHSIVSERTTLFFISLNAAVLFFDAFPAIHASPAGHWLHIIDYGCILFFVLELVLKLILQGRRGYFSQAWNVFDFTVVVLSLPALLVPFGVAQGEGFVAILLLRLIRLSRFMRALRFIPRLERLVAGAQRALRASTGVMLAMLFYLFIFGLAATYLFGQPDSPAHAKFSDPLVSMYSMFTVFTVEGWFETPDLIAGESGYWAAHAIRAFFVLAVITGGIILLSLLNAVFVEEMSSDLSEQQEDSFEKLDVELAQLKSELLQRLEAIEARIAERSG
ncbi:ion transporter [bacterium]|nr:ion transporter [bacterium]